MLMSFIPLAPLHHSRAPPWQHAPGLLTRGGEACWVSDGMSSFALVAMETPAL